MNKKILVVFVLIIWFCKPLSYEDLVNHRHKNQLMEQKILVLRSGSHQTENSLKILVEDLVQIHQNYLMAKNEFLASKTNLEDFQRLNNIKENNFMDLSPLQLSLYDLYAQRFRNSEENKLESKKFYLNQKNEINNFIRQISPDEKKELSYFLRNLKQTCDSKYDKSFATLLKYEIDLLIPLLAG